MGSLLKRWSTCFGIHGAALAMFSFWIVWERRHELIALTAKPNLFFGSIIMVIGCLALIVSKVTAIAIIGYAAIALTLIGCILCVFGTNHLKILAAPLGLWVLMFPIYSELWKTIGFHLHTISMWSIYHGLRLLDAEVYLSEGHHAILFHRGEIPNSLNITAIPGGFDQLVAITGIAFIISWVTQRTKTRMFLFVAYALLTCALINFGRLLFIAYSTIHNRVTPRGSLLALMWEPSSTFFIGLICLSPLFFVFWKHHHREQFWFAEKPERTEPTPENHKDVQKAFIVSLLILFLPIVVLYIYSPLSTMLPVPLEQLPRNVQSWVGRDAILDNEIFREISAPVQLKRLYHDSSGHELKLYIGYFPVQQSDEKVFHWRFQILQETRLEHVVLHTMDGKYTINKIVRHDNNGHQTYWFWYITDGKIVAHPYMNAFLIIRNWLGHRTTSSAIIIVSSELGNESQGVQNERAPIEFIRSLLPLLNHFMMIPW